jgi:hypothetical protein
MFRELEAIIARPAVHSVTTTELLWADPYIAEQMLQYHLGGTSTAPRGPPTSSTAPSPG